MNESTCRNCRRDHDQIAVVRVEHGWYACDCGCCGFEVGGYDRDGNRTCGYFDFGHPDDWNREAATTYGQRLAAEQFGPSLPVEVEWDDQYRHLDLYDEEPN